MTLSSLLAQSLAKSSARFADYATKEVLMMYQFMYKPVV